MIEVGFPFQLDSRGQMYSPSYDAHVEEMIELVLFTFPGERVNRPDFGCGLLRTIFASITAEEISAVQFAVQSALHKWLGDVIQVKSVQVTVPAQSSLEVTVMYVVLRDRTRRTSTYRYQVSA